MRPARWIGAAVVIATLAAFAFGVGCTSVLAIPSDSLRWCDQAANHHDFCEDFDHADELAAWPASPMPLLGTSRSFVAGESSPYALDTLVGSLDAGEPGFTGLDTSFSQPFSDVTVGLDLRVVQANFESVGDLQTGAGFMLLADFSTEPDEPSLCVGLVLVPASLTDAIEVAVVLVPNATDCITVNDQTADGATAPVGAMTPTADDSGAPTSSLPSVPTPYPVAEVYLNTWTHISLEVVRADDGSGTLHFATSGSGGGGALPAIPPNSLGAGTPTLDIGTDVTGPSGTFELQFDNVTADFGG